MKTIYTDAELTAYDDRKLTKHIGYLFPDKLVLNDDTVIPLTELHIISIDTETIAREKACKCLTKIKNDDIREVLSYLLFK